MKQFFLLLAFFGGFALMNVQAQGCHGNASASANKESAQWTAAKVAAADKSIEERVDPKTGEVSYVRKNTQDESGKATYTALVFDAATGQFVEPSASAMSCCAAKSAQEAGKSCCASGGSKMAGCGDDQKKAKAEAKAVRPSSTVKLVKTDKP